MKNEEERVVATSPDTACNLGMSQNSGAFYWSGIIA